jgi:hypothetical protein
MRTQKSESHVVLAGVLIALAVIAVTGVLVVVLLSGTNPAVTVAVLTGFAGILSAVPPIIKALRGDDARLR